MGPTRSMTRSFTRPATRSRHGLTETVWIVRNGALSPAASFSRASSATWWTGSAFHTFAQDVPRFDDQGRLVVMPGATELSAYSIAPLLWVNVGATKSATGDTEVLGLFSPARIASQGASWHITRCVSVGAGSAGDVFAIQMIYSAGTSGTGRLSIRNGTTGLETVVEGTIGSLATAFEEAGAVAFSEVPLGLGVYALRGLLTLAADAPGTLGIGFGPWTAVTGQDVLVYGGSVRKLPVLEEDWIVTDGASATRAADVLTYTPTETEDISLVGTAWDGTAYPEGAPLVLAHQAAPLTFPAGRWSRAWATPAA